MLIFIYIIRWSGVTFTGRPAAVRQRRPPQLAPDARPLAAAPALPSARFCAGDPFVNGKAADQRPFSLSFSKDVFWNYFYSALGWAGIHALLRHRDAVKPASISSSFHCFYFFIVDDEIASGSACASRVPFALITVRRDGSVSRRLSLFLS